MPAPKRKVMARPYVTEPEPAATARIAKSIGATLLIAPNDRPGRRRSEGCYR